MSINYRIILFLIFFNQESYGLDCQTCDGSFPLYLTEFDKFMLKKIIKDSTICVDSKNVGTSKTCDPGSVCHYFVIQSHEKFASKIK